MRRALLALAALAYVATLLWLVVGLPFVFLSPDENANFAFAEAQRVATSLWLPEPLNEVLQGVVHPRSVVAVGTMLLPGSFFGLPVVAGLFGKVFGALSMQLVTPLLTVLAVAAWYGIIKRLFADTRLATIAAIAFAIHPAVWYYAARPMMHNVAFVSCLVYAVWFAVVRPFAQLQWLRRADVVHLFFAGLMVGLALFFRTAEVLWVVALSGLGLLALRGSMSRLAAASGVLGLCIMLGVIGWYNLRLFGSPFVNGYTVEDAAPVVAVITATPEPVLEREPWFVPALGYLLPFGFHEYAMLRNIGSFGIALFPWMTVLAAAGMASVVVHGRWGERDLRWRRLLAVTLGLAVWLGIVYGSWSFNDNPDPAAVTLGDSHVRYWLPLFILSTPFIARAVMLLVAPFAKRVQLLLLCGVIGLLVLASGGLVLFSSDGFVPSRAALAASVDKRATILEYTEPESVIVVDRADKFVWPYRRVVQPLRSERTYAAMPGIAAQVPLYYFGITFPPSDIAYLNDEKLAGLGLHISEVVTTGDETLYRITPVEPYAVTP